MLLLPPKEDVCPICATDHPAEQPHNQQSMYYQYRFYGVRGRWPTWADAIAHCSERIRELWEQELRKCESWSEPEDGEPIADPVAESVHQTIGDVSEPGFGDQQ